MKAVGMGLEPGKSRRVLKHNREVGGGVAGIAQIHRIARAVFGVAGGSTHLSPLLGALIALGLHVEKDVLLGGDRTEGTQNAQFNALSTRRLLHGHQGFSRIGMQLHAWGNAHQIRGRGLAIGKVAEQAAIQTRAGAQTFNRGWCQQPTQGLGEHDQHGGTATKQQGGPHQASAEAARTAERRGNRATGQGNVVPQG